MNGLVYVLLLRLARLTGDAGSRIRDGIDRISVERTEHALAKMSECERREYFAREKEVRLFARLRQEQREEAAAHARKKILLIALLVIGMSIVMIWWASNYDRPVKHAGVSQVLVRPLTPPTPVADASQTASRHPVFSDAVADYAYQLAKAYPNCTDWITPNTGCPLFENEAQKLAEELHMEPPELGADGQLSQEANALQSLTLMVNAYRWKYKCDQGMMEFCGDESGKDSFRILLDTCKDTSVPSFNSECRRIEERVRNDLISSSATY